MSSSILEFPGPSPGAARSKAQGNTLLLENDLLSVRWHLSEGLHLDEVKDKQSGEALTANPCECLQIVFCESPSPGRRILKTSEMDLVGRPIVRTATVAHASGRGAEKYAGKEFVVHLAAKDRSLLVEWRASLRDEANYVRQTVVIEATHDWVELYEVILLDLEAREAVVLGSIDGSPAVAGRWFMGLEHPMSRSDVADDAGEAEGPRRRVRCSYPYAPPLEPGRKQEYSSVVGLTPVNQLRRGFLYYLERERAHPYRQFLLQSPGEDMAAMYASLSGNPEETRAFSLGQEKWWWEVIEAFGQELVRNRSVVIDCFAHDYLWDSLESPWQFNDDRYPEGFSASRRIAEKYGADLGIWFSPDAVTGGHERIVTGMEQKFEGFRVGDTNANLTLGLSLAGSRYYARFRGACINMIRRYGVGYFKFDGIADGYNYGYKPDGAGPWSSDVEALLRLESELRVLKPDVFINSSTGSWPSPFWLRWADALWHQGADVGTYGPEFTGWSKGSPRQRWLTFRDNATFHNGLERSPLYPLNSYMLHGLEFNLASTGTGRVRVKGLETKDIIDEIRSYFGTGTNLMELYTHPSVFTSQIWDVLADAAKWSRANSDVLQDTHWVGGDPAKDEVYGWASWAPRKGILTLRNPDDKPRSINLDVATVFELPEGAHEKYRLKSPWRDQAGRGAIELVAGRDHDIELQPFEVLVLDATPL